jgi:hypothetical protein
MSLLLLVNRLELAQLALILPVKSNGFCPEAELQMSFLSRMVATND